MRSRRADNLFGRIARFDALCAAALRAAVGERRVPGPAAFLATRQRRRRMAGCVGERFFQEIIAHSISYQGACARIIQGQREGVGRSRVKAAHHSPAVRGRFVVVQLHLGPGADGTASMRDHSDRVRAAGWESGTTRGPSPPGRRCAAGRLRLRGT